MCRGDFIENKKELMPRAPTTLWKLFGVEKYFSSFERFLLTERTVVEGGQIGCFGHKRRDEAGKETGFRKSNSKQTWIWVSERTERCGGSLVHPHLNRRFSNRQRFHNGKPSTFSLRWNQLRNHNAIGALICAHYRRSFRTLEEWRVSLLTVKEVPGPSLRK